MDKAPILTDEQINEELKNVKYWDRSAYPELNYDNVVLFVSKLQSDIAEYYTKRIQELEERCEQFNKDLNNRQRILLSAVNERDGLRELIKDLKSKYGVE